MNEDYDKTHWAQEACPKVNCREKACKCGLKKVFLAAALGDDSKNSPIAPKNGAYCNAIVVYEANEHVYIYSAEGIPTLVNTDGDARKAIEKLEKDLAQEILDRQTTDNTLQQEIDDIKNSPDVVDIVATYADLEAYDTSHLGDKDIIRVLTDETHDGASSYYRWDKQTETWTYVGSIQTTANTIFYANLSETGNTRHIYKNSDMTGTVSVQELLDANEDGQVILRMSSTQTPENFNDAYLQNTYVGVSDYQFLFLDNRNYYEYDATTTADTTYYYSKSTIQLEMSAGTNITITGNTISATDTTYSNFTGTDGVTAGTAGLVPAPATTDAGKFLKADGTWDTAGGGGGSVTTLTSADFNYPVNNPDGIAMWLLPDGDYVTTLTSDYVYPDNAASKQLFRYFSKITDGNSAIAYYTDTDNVWKYWNTNKNTGARISFGRMAPRVQQTIGTSQTDVMSQDATTKMVYPDIANKPYKMVIGEGYVNSNKGVSINGRVENAALDGIAIGCMDGSPASIGANGRANYSISIGRDSYVSRGDTSVALGASAGCNSGQNTGDNVAIGYSSYAGNASGTSTVALGAYAKTTRTGEVNVGAGTSGTGYNSTNYRVIGGVHDPVDAHDAATKGYVDGKVLSGAGAPTTSTVGAVGQIYEDTTNGKLYQCTAIDTTDPDNPTYTWSEVGAGGGGGPTVVQTTGTSTTDVMSQDATTKMIYPDITNSPNKIGIGSSTLSSNGVAIQGNLNNTTAGSIAIGGSGGSKANVGANGKAQGSIAIGADSAVGRGDYSISIGTNSYCYSTSTYPYNVALGPNANVSNVDFSVALGANATPTRTGEVNIGTGSWTTSGYNSSNYRVLGGVYDGQNAHDAATVGQALGTTETYTVATSDWTALSASSPYTYQADVTATYTIGANTIVELLNSDPVSFANYGFVVGSVSSQTVTLYAIGQPSANVTLKINYKG